MEADTRPEQPPTAGSWPRVIVWAVVLALLVALAAGSHSVGAGSCGGREAWSVLGIRKLRLLASLPPRHDVDGPCGADEAAALEAAAGMPFLPPLFVRIYLLDGDAGAAGAGGADGGLCGVFQAWDGGARVALVGGGPLSAADRAAVAAAPTVVRPKELRGLAGAPSGHAGAWVVAARRAQEAAGPQEASRRKRASLLFSSRAPGSPDMLAAAEAALGGGGRQRVEAARYSWDTPADGPFARRAGEALDWRQAAVQLRGMRGAGGAGLAMLNLVLYCLPPGGRVDLYGFGGAP